MALSPVSLTGLRVRRMPLMPIEFGNQAQGVMGGAMLQLNRPGARWAVAVETAQMAPAEAQMWSGLLVAAKRKGARLEVTIAGADPGTPGSPEVAANVASGRVFTITGLTPGYEVRGGQPLTLVTSAGRFLDLNEVSVTADVDGEATVTIANLLRAPLTAGDQVLLAPPTIDGAVVDLQPWQNDEDEVVSFSFTIAEFA